MTHELRSRIDAWFLEKNGFRLTDEELDRIISLCMEEAARCAELMAQDENGALEHSDTEAEKDQHQHGAWVAHQIAALIRHRALATPEGR